jgi:hypothetical protein
MHTGIGQVGWGSLHHVIPKQWRQRLAYAGMSLLVTWHTFAMVVAPSPDSDITDAARSILDPYLTLFRLDNGWGFFAPEVGRGSQFRYVIEDAAGNRYTFIPAETLNRFHPTSIWMRDRYIAVMEKPRAYADAAGASLCRDHAALKPIAVTLLELEQKEFLPADRLKGKRPLDPEFVTLKTVKTVPCTAK